MCGGMADIRMLTDGQALSLETIMRGLRERGFDVEGRGVYSSNLHVEPRTDRRIAWWLDGDDGYANGLLDAAGHGVWWLRRAYSPTLNIV